MKKYLLIGIIVGLLALGGALLLKEPTAKATFSGYTYQRTLTVANASSTQSSFPVLVSFNSTGSSTVATDLKATSSGGSIIILSASSTPNDLIFSTSTDASSILPFEIEKYASSTGELLAWVKMPTVANNQILYMYYGKSGDTDHRNATGVWDTNYKGVWHLPNGTSLTANDSTGVNNASVQGTASPVAGQVDGGQSFSGTTNYDSLLTNASLNITGSITISAWEKTSSANNMHIVGGYNASSPFSGYGFGINSGGSNAGVLQYWDGSGWRSATTNTYNNGAWHYVTVAVSGTTVRFYKDGNPDGTPVGQVPGSYSGVRALGGRSDGAAPFLGNLDEIRVSNSARSADWVKTEYNNQYDPTTFWTVSGASTGPATAVTPEVTITNAAVKIMNSAVTIKGN